MTGLTTAAGTSVDKLFSELNSSPGGLEAIEAQRRLKVYGPNLLAASKNTTWRIFINQFKNPFLYLLVFASLASLFLRQNQQGITILVIIFVTALFGFLLEYRSQRAEEKLASFLKEKCWLKRNGENEEVDKSLLVPGDLVSLQAGDIVPADCRLVHQENLLLDEAVFSGESLPVEKVIKPLAGAKTVTEARNLLFSGTAVRSGLAQGLVFATGPATQIGHISQLVAKTTHRSSFELVLKSVSRFILRLAIIALGTIFLANLLIKGNRADVDSLFLFVIALAVGIVPEALPVVSLFTMSLGALNLAQHKVVVKRLTALEDLGKIEVLCVDKTGTLTENELSVAAIWAGEPKKFWQFFMASVAPFLGKQKRLKSYLDQVIFDYGQKKNFSLPDVQLVKKEPFSPQVRRERLVIKQNHHDYLVVKGAPEMILAACTFSKKSTGAKNHSRKYWQKIIKQEGAKGRRVYGLAIKELPDWPNHQDDSLGKLEKDLVFLGLASLYDPIKKTAFGVIKKAGALNVAVKVLTGDSAEVAGWVAQKLEIIQDSREVVESAQLTKLSKPELRDLVLKSAVFTRVTPEQKYQIVEILQEKYWTAFLGDGVNDAPALKLADVSFVVDHATDVARAAADVILLKKDLGVVLRGVEQGRRIFCNVIKYLQYTLASNFGNSYSLALISLLLPFLPMLPAQILLVNLLSDFPLIFVATDNVDFSLIQKPVVFDLRRSGLLIVFLGLISMIFDFFFLAVFYHQPAATLQTLWFVESVLSEIIFIISIRSRLPFWRAKPPSWSLVGLLLLATVGAFWLPFSFLAPDFSFARPTQTQLSLVVLIVLAYFVVTEMAKLTYYRNADRRDENRT